MNCEPRVRRYITADKAEQLREAGRAEMTTTGALTYNIMSDAWTEWYVVPDTDPRVDTIEELTAK